MVTLQDTCCLDINFDTKNYNILYGEGVSPKARYKVSLSHLIPTLLNKSLVYPEVVYEEHQQVLHDTDRKSFEEVINYDLVFLPSGLLGIEFIRTHIYYTPEETDNKYSTIVEVHLGVLTVIMQKNAPKDEYDFDTSVAEGLVIKLKKGEKLAIPTGYYYTFINTEDNPVIFVRIFNQDPTIETHSLKKENGLAYYCIRKNAKQEIVHNPLYKNIPKIKEMSGMDFVRNSGIDSGVGIYEQLRQNLTNILSILY